MEDLQNMPEPTDNSKLQIGLKPIPLINGYIAANLESTAVGISLSESRGRGEGQSQDPVQDLAHPRIPCVPYVALYLGREKVIKPFTGAVAVQIIGTRTIALFVQGSAL